MNKTYQRILIKQPITLFAVLFTALSIIFGILIPAEVSLLLAFIVLIWGISRKKENWRIHIFIATAFISGILSDVVLSTEPLIMGIMLLNVILIFIAYKIASSYWKTLVIFFVFLFVATSFFNFVQLGVPTALIAMLTVLSSYLFYQEKTLLLKEIAKNK